MSDVFREDNCVIASLLATAGRRGAAVRVEREGTVCNKGSNTGKAFSCVRKDQGVFSRRVSPHALEESYAAAGCTCARLLRLPQQSARTSAARSTRLGRKRMATTLHMRQPHQRKM